jgi:DNA-directed RNA polymerase subunit RPC12/RpoP
MKKINLEKVRASLSMRCPQCGHNIQPDELRRMDTDHVRCPQCHAAFDPCLERKGDDMPSLQEGNAPSA